MSLEDTRDGGAREGVVRAVLALRPCQVCADSLDRQLITAVTGWRELAYAECSLGMTTRIMGNRNCTFAYQLLIFCLVRITRPTA